MRTTRLPNRIVNGLVLPAIVGLALCASSISALAVGWQTQMSCASDYYAYCSQYAPGTAEVRKCMRANGPKLSKACINALISDGEVSAKEVAERRAEAKSKIAKAKPEAAKGVAKTAEVSKPGQRATKAVAKSATEPKRQTAKIAETDKPRPATSPARTSATENNLAARHEPVKAPLPAVEAPAPNPVIAPLVLDQETYAALKAREPRFVIDDGIEVSLQYTPAAEASVQTGDAAQIEAWEARVESYAEGVPSIDDEPAAAEATPQKEPAQKSVQRPSGRMSLGRLPPRRQPRTWWDDIVDMLTSLANP